MGSRAVSQQGLFQNTGCFHSYLYQVHCCRSTHLLCVQLGRSEQGSQVSHQASGHHLGYLFAKLPGYASDELLALATLVVSAANVLLLDEPTNNLDPASREEILGALGEYQGAVIMVSHDEGAVQALKPERVILLPDGDEDIWKDEYFDLVSID